MQAISLLDDAADTVGIASRAYQLCIVDLAHVVATIGASSEA